jgi:hypothetical protein
MNIHQLVNWQTNIECPCIIVFCGLQAPTGMLFQAFFHSPSLFYEKNTIASFHHLSS